MLKENIFIQHAINIGKKNIKQMDTMKKQIQFMSLIDQYGMEIYKQQKRIIQIHLIKLLMENYMKKH